MRRGRIHIIKAVQILWQNFTYQKGSGRPVKGPQFGRWVSGT